MEFNNAIRKLFKGSVITVIGLVLELGISFVAKLLVARQLGTTQFGVLTLGLAFIGFVASLGILGMDTAVARFLPRYDDPIKRNEIMVIGYALALPVPLAVSAVTAFSPDTVATLIGAPEAAPSLRLFAVATPFSAFVGVSLGIIRGQKRSVPNVVVKSIAEPTVRLLAVGGGVVLGVTVFGFSFAYILPHFVAFGLCVVILRDNLLSPRLPSDAVIGTELLLFALPLVLSAVMNRILTDIDTFLLSYYDTTAAVGIYGVIYPLAKLLTVGLTGGGYLFMPLLSEQHTEGQREDMQRMYQVATKWIFVGTLPVFLVFMLYPTYSIALTFGWEYVDGTLALQILALGFFLDAIFGLNSSVLSSTGYTKQIATAQAIAAIVNVALNVVLIPRYSFVGAAAATTVSLFLMNGYISLRVYRLLDVQPFTKAILLPAISAVLLLLATQTVTIQLIGLSPFVAVAMFGVFVALYLFTILSFGGIEEEEVLIVNSFEERFDIDLEPIKRVARKLM